MRSIVLFLSLIVVASAAPQLEIGGSGAIAKAGSINIGFGRLQASISGSIAKSGSIGLRLPGRRNRPTPPWQAFGNEIEGDHQGFSALDPDQEQNPEEFVDHEHEAFAAPEEIPEEHVEEIPAEEVPVEEIPVEEVPEVDPEAPVE